MSGLMMVDKIMDAVGYEDLVENIKDQLMLDPTAKIQITVNGEDDEDDEDEERSNKWTINFEPIGKCKDIEKLVSYEVPLWVTSDVDFTFKQARSKLQSWIIEELKKSQYFKKYHTDFSTEFHGYTLSGYQYIKFNEDASKIEIEDYGIFRLGC